MIQTRPWTFNVICSVDHNEKVCLTGSCDSLGNWDARKLVVLEKQANGGDTSHIVTVHIPCDEVEFRYCVCVEVDSLDAEGGSKFIIKRWESNIIPRTIPRGVMTPHHAAIHKFGEYGGGRHIDRGWLVDDSMVQLKFCKSNLYDDPLILWKKKYHKYKLRLKVTPIKYGCDENEPQFTASSLDEITEETDLSTHRENSSTQKLIEVAVMKSGQEIFKPQDQFGVYCDNLDYIIFQCRTLHPESVVFLIDIYAEQRENDIPTFLGCTFLHHQALTENYGIQKLTIQSPRQTPIGQLTVHYMVVKPLDSGNTDMHKTYSRYWKESWTGLQVGHRGAGNSYDSCKPKSCAIIRENTIASLKYAADNGADMVEFDVQLSRDLIPVIYHDFHACIALKNKKDKNPNDDLLEMPIKDLSLQQLQSLKDLSHLNEGVPCDILSFCDNEDMLVFNLKENGQTKYLDDDFEDHQPFPTLEKALETVPVCCGFNIEVKWTMQMKDGSYELKHPFELNAFMDIILKLVLEKSGDRKIVFSCFHPDICTLLRAKQNKFPVLFLTQGVSEFWPPYDDELTTSIHNAVLYAVSAEILGVNVHTEDLIRDPNQMDLALKNNLVVFCWGDDNNDKKNLQYLIEKGMHGIIHDKIDVYNYNTDKRSVFFHEGIQNSTSINHRNGDSL